MNWFLYDRDLRHERVDTGSVLTHFLTFRFLTFLESIEMEYWAKMNQCKIFLDAQ